MPQKAILTRFAPSSIVTDPVVSDRLCDIMDSNEAANLAQIENTRLSRWLVFLAIVQIVSPFVYHWLSTPSDSNVPPTGGGFVMPGWLPTVFFVSSFAVTTLTLLIVAWKRWRNKRLASEVSDLTTLVANLKVERQDALDRAAAATKDALKANQRAVDADNEKKNTYAQFQDTERQLNDLNWLASRVNEQAKDISKHVVITKVRPGILMTKGDRYATVEFVIRNESVFDITVQGRDITGSFFFKHQALTEQAKLDIAAGHPPVLNLESMKEATFSLLQPLIRWDAERVEEALADENARFWLGNLRIPISVENAPQKVETKPLRIGKEVEDVLLKDCRKTNNE